MTDTATRESNEALLRTIKMSPDGDTVVSAAKVLMLLESLDEARASMASPTKTIFVLTVFFLITPPPMGSPESPIKRHRTWGWFPTLKDAEEAVMTNDGDMYEMGYYNTAVIEEVEWGSCALAKAEHWYTAPYLRDTEGDKYDVKKIDKPSCLEGQCNFGMG
jgi:hypothetical protein